MPTAAEMVAEAKHKVQNLTTEETARELDAGEAMLVDVREPGERAQNGAIPGAIEAPRGMLEFGPTPRARITAISSVRTAESSCTALRALAVVTLQDLGYTNVAHMDGGITAWKDAGNPVV
jgi:rhodanese-related sulfurtransferase